MTRKIEQRDVCAFGCLREVRDRLFETIEVEVFLYVDRKSDPRETFCDQARVEGGVGEGRVGIGAVGDDERDTAAGGSRLGDIGRGRPCNIGRI